MNRIIHLILLALLATSCMSTRDRKFEEIDPNAETWQEDIDVKLSNLCACQDGLPIQLDTSETCQRFCSTVKPEAAVYLDAQLNQEVLATFGITSLYEWCTKDRTDEFGDVTSANSGCVIRAKDSLSGQTQELKVEVAVGSNQLVANLPEGFRNNVNYQLILVENSSESISTSIQFMKVDAFTAGSSEAIGVIGVKRYQCNVAYINEDQSLPPISYQYEKNFYISATNPEILPLSFIQQFSIFCHARYPAFLDSPGEARIGIQEEFPMFHPNDPKFWDLDKDGRLAIEELLEAKTDETFEEGLFSSITYQTSPSSTAKTMGFMLHPIIEQNASRCPKISDYNSSDTLYQALGEVFKFNNQQFELEPLYEAKRLPLNIIGAGNIAYPEPTTERFGEDIIYVRKSQIDTQWYTYAGPDLTTEVQLNQDGSNIAPGTDVFFKIRSNIAAGNPFRTYKIRHAGGSDQGITHDKRIGCIPSI